MFSNDQNIETITQLIETVRHYVGLQSEYVRLDAVEKTVRLLTALVVAALFFTLIILMLIYLSFAAAYALEPRVGIVAAFAIVAAFYLFVLLLVFCFRRRWIEKPLVRFFVALLLSK